MSAAAVLLSLLAFEIYVRATWQGQWQIPRDAVRAPGIFSLQMKPDHDADLAVMDGNRFHVRTNARGFRGPLVSSIAHDTVRVIFLGDSFTFGWGVAEQEQGLWKFADSHRRAFPDRDIGYASVASPSWSPKDYYLAFLTEAAEVRPNLVVVGVFTGNDVLPADTPREVDPARVPYIETIADPPAPWLRSIDWLRARLSGSLFIAKLRARQAPASYAVFDDNASRQRDLWDTTFFYLDRLNDVVRRDGGQLVIVLYPSMLQVSTPEALRGAGYNPDLPERVVGAFADEKKIAFIPLLDSLRASGERDLYFPKDRHLTVRGHAITAEVFDRTLGPIVDRVWQANAQSEPR